MTDRTDDLKAAADQVARAATRAPAAVDPDVADHMGAFTETALSDDDALDALFDGESPADDDDAGDDEFDIGFAGDDGEAGS